MGVFWTVTNEGFAKPVTLSADPSGILEGFVYYNDTLKVWRMFNGTIFISMSSAAADLQGVTDIGATTTNAISLTGAATLTLPAGASIGEFSIDDTFGGNSDAAVPTEKATKTLHDSHANLTSNPHTVTAAQVGNTIAQWNANEIQGNAVLAGTPNDGDVYAFVAANSRFEATAQGGTTPWIFEASNSGTTVTQNTFVGFSSLTPRKLWLLRVRIKNTSGSSSTDIHVRVNNDAAAGRYSSLGVTSGGVWSWLSNDKLDIRNVGSLTECSFDIIIDGRKNRFQSMTYMNPTGGSADVRRGVFGTWKGEADVTILTFTALSVTFDFDAQLFYWDG